MTDQEKFDSEYPELARIVGPDVARSVFGGFKAGLAYEKEHAEVVRWTNVPPTEVGWYWWRVNNADDEPQIFSCDPPDIFIGNDARMATEMRGEWWPTPIEPPKG